MRPTPHVPKSTKERSLNAYQYAIEIDQDLGHTLPPVDFTKDGIINGSIDKNSRMSSF